MSTFSHIVHFVSPSLPCLILNFQACQLPPLGKAFPGTENEGLLLIKGDWNAGDYSALGVSVVRAGVAWRPLSPCPSCLPLLCLSPCLLLLLHAPSLPACLLYSLLPVSLPVPPPVLPFQIVHLRFLRQISSWGTPNSKQGLRVSRYTAPCF